MTFPQPQRDEGPPLPFGMRIVPGWMRKPTMTPGLLRPAMTCIFWNGSGKTGGMKAANRSCMTRTRRSFPSAKAGMSESPIRNMD